MSDLRTVTAVCNICATGATAAPGETIRIPRAEAEALVLAGAAVWTDAGHEPGDLTLISGIGPAIARKLAAADCAGLAALAGLSDAALAAVADEVPGVTREDLIGWRSAAARLREDDE